MASDLPMPKPVVPRKPFTSCKSISFDINGTLIDWETSIIRQCKPLYDATPADSPYKHTDTDNSARSSERHTLDSQGTAVLMQDSSKIEAQATKFGSAIGEWIAFPDTVEAMQRLAKHYKLVPLSNNDRANLTRTHEGPLAGVDFWRVYTAEDAGSYKPDLKTFDYLLEYLDADDKSEGGSGITKEQNLMVAQRLASDHVPCKQMGMSSVWIKRKGAGIQRGSAAQDLHDSEEVGYGWRLNTLGEFADAVDKEWAEKR